MARGWESKAVEQQQNEADQGVSPVKLSKTDAEVATEQMRQGLELSRQRVLQQLQSACNPNHRNMLETALRELEDRISRLDLAP
jgi:signal recognition particle GTPase